MKQNILNGQTNQPVYIREDSEVIKRLEFEIAQNSTAISENTESIESLQEQVDDIGSALVLNVVDFGADPIGVKDSTSAIQEAVDKLNNTSTGECHNAYIFFPAGTYLMSGTVTMQEKYNFVLDASATTIKYTGNSYPFELIRGFHCEFRFGTIDTRSSDYWDNPYVLSNTIDTSRGCFIINATTASVNQGWTKEITNANTEFCHIYFKEFFSNDDSPCIYMVEENMNNVDQWIGDIAIHDGKFRSGYGVYVKQKSDSVKTPQDCLVTGIRFHDVIFAGTNQRPLTCGFRYDSPSANAVKSDFGFYACRSAENYVRLIDFASDGFDTTVDDFTWVGSSLFNITYQNTSLGISARPTLSFTTKTSGCVIADVYDSNGVRLSKNARVCCGEIIPENYDKLFYTDGAKDVSNKKGTEIGRYIRVNAGSNVDSIILPRFYFEKNGINDFYLTFNNDHANFYINVKRGAGVNYFVKTIQNIKSGDVVHVVRMPYSNAWTDLSNEKVYAFFESEESPKKHYQHNIYIHSNRCQIVFSFINEDSTNYDSVGDIAYALNSCGYTEGQYSITANGMYESQGSDMFMIISSYSANGTDICFLGPRVTNLSTTMFGGSIIFGGITLINDIVHEI